MGRPDWFRAMFRRSSRGEDESAGWRLGERDGQLLARIAAEALRAGLLEIDLAPVQEDLPEALRSRKPLFLTVEAPPGEIRGCLGSIEPGDGLALEVRRLALEILVDTGRFPPPEPKDLPDLYVKVSVLSEPR